jgi:hypothetical protein
MRAYTRAAIHIRACALACRHVWHQVIGRLSLKPIHMYRVHPCKQVHGCTYAHIRMIHTHLRIHVYGLTQVWQRGQVLGRHPCQCRWCARYVCMYVCIHKCVRVCVCVCVCVCSCVCMCVCVCVYVCMYLRVYVCMYLFPYHLRACAHTCICICIQEDLGQ